MPTKKAHAKNGREKNGREKNGREKNGRAKKMSAKEAAAETQSTTPPEPQRDVATTPVAVAQPANPPVPAADLSDARRLEGKARRKDCPRSSHGETVLGQDKRDPLALIEQSNEGRLKDLLPIRFQRMAPSPFTFFRGTANLQAHDLQGTPNSGITVQCCGDCHFMNFGGFATPERLQIFDINDFDETFPAPFEWDVKRLATSFVLASRDPKLKFSLAEIRTVVSTAVAAYRSVITDLATRTVLETWYAHIAVEDMYRTFAEDPKFLKMTRKETEKAAKNTSDHVFNKHVTTADGTPRIVDQPPKVFHPAADEFDVKKDVIPFFARYRETLPADRQMLFDRFRLVDGAYKVVGVGSVGTRCMIALFLGEAGEPLFLQLKEARPSVLEGHAGASPFKNNGERVVVGQRLMQSASDIFLGWSTDPKGRDFYVRQLRDQKFAPNVAEVTPRSLGLLANLCGRTLGRAHAKCGAAASIAGYVGTSDAFDEAILKYAQAYADQVEADYEEFKKGIESGRFPVAKTADFGDR
ncbi:MAG TPA: DUF2252 domain-containing protein [Gemmataceae bacterium]|nr:DUF2252 domain-containing protein [Gemmataceae bacterium]